MNQKPGLSPSLLAMIGLYLLILFTIIFAVVVL